MIKIYIMALATLAHDSEISIAHQWSYSVYKRMKYPVLVLIILLSFSAQSGEVETFDGECGLSQKVNGYEFNYANYKYFMPKLGILMRSGTEIYKGERVWDWWTLNSGAETHRTKDYLIARIWGTDCVDIYWGQIFIISSSGELLLNQFEWTSNWVNGFFYENDRLAYWSEWFCKTNEEGSPYIYLLDDGKTSFYRKKVERDAYCSTSFKDNFKSLMLQYVKLVPIE